KGDAGNDTLDGGAGNDQLNGGTGNDVYLFGKGDGQDLIHGHHDASATKLNVLRFKEGVAPEDISAKRIYDSGYESLELSIAGTTDKVTVRYFFSGDNPANTNNPIQQVEFADGTTWGISDLVSKVLMGTDDADTLTGLVSD